MSRSSPLWWESTEVSPIYYYESSDRAAGVGRPAQPTPSWAPAFPVPLSTSNLSSHPPTCFLHPLGTFRTPCLYLCCAFCLLCRSPPSWLSELPFIPQDLAQMSPCDTFQMPIPPRPVPLFHTTNTSEFVSSVLCSNSMQRASQVMLSKTPFWNLELLAADLTRGNHIQNHHTIHTVPPLALIQGHVLPCPCPLICSWSHSCTVTYVCHLPLAPACGHAHVSPLICLRNADQLKSLQTWSLPTARPYLTWLPYLHPHPLLHHPGILLFLWCPSPLRLHSRFSHMPFSLFPYSLPNSHSAFRVLLEGQFLKKPSLTLV